MRRRIVTLILATVVLVTMAWLFLPGTDHLPDRCPVTGHTSARIASAGAEHPSELEKHTGRRTLDGDRAEYGDEEGEEDKTTPNDWYWRQRAYPSAEISLDGYRLALQQADAKLAEARELRARMQAAGRKNALLTNPWEQRGPTNIGARVTDLAVHPTNPDIAYAAMASGGVFKTTDGGDHWLPLFDDEQVLSVGAVALDPQEPNTVYVGTGEANAGSYSFFGVGLYRSLDAGATWEHIGLDESRYIARIVVHPTNSDRIFVATTGQLFGSNPERGVYRSLNGGDTWERSLAVTDSTAAIDLVINPSDPDILFAAMWERVRGLNYRRSGGPSSGVYRTTDGGDNWSELTNGLPGGSNVGRIGLTLCASQPSILYAIYADATGWFEGVYKTTNGGNSWTATNDGALSSLFSSYGWWFGNIRVDPSNPNNVFALGLPIYRTTNGGSSWYEVGQNMHVDHHAMAFAPSQPTRVYEGNDAGVYLSTNSGAGWTKLYDQPTNQFYAIAIDNLDPDRLYGGTQDNGTQCSFGLGTDNWDHVLWGDGFYCIVDPTDSDIVFAESQWGNLAKSTNGGGSFSSSTDGIDSGDRTNWSTPVVMDPTNPQVMYYGSYRVYKSTNQGDWWTAISDDLTGGDHGANYGTVTTIAVAPSDPNTIYAGTDDGRVWKRNAFGNWVLISGALPDRWVTRVAVDPLDAQIAYATFSGLRWDEPLGHVYRTDDGGFSWDDISNDLPEAPVNVILVDPEQPSTLFVGTDVGCYISTNTGASWQVLGEGLPRAPLLDLKFHLATRTLVAGTHGRSMFSMVVPVITAVDDGESAGETPLAAVVGLSNYPNPFNPQTIVEYSLTRPARVRLTVFNAAGQQIARLVDEEQSAGRHAVRFDGRDQHGAALPSGVYFARIEAGDAVFSQKMSLVR